MVEASYEGIKQDDSYVLNGVHPSGHSSMHSYGCMRMLREINMHINTYTLNGHIGT